VSVFDRYRPRFFTPYEWAYHLAMMPVLFPLGNYYFIGPRYFTDARAFVAGTAVVFGLYWLSILVLTAAVRRVIARYPEVGQGLPRTGSMLLVVGVLTAALAVFDVWVYSQVPATGVAFRWEAVRPIWVLGAAFDVALCLALSLFYALARWKRDEAESEQLQRAALQRQFDTLKGQVNPHFLFNSLSSLSALIGENPAEAERFVDELSKVYRYLLQAGSLQRISLQAELEFLTHYAYLLSVRYGASLRLTQDVPVSLHTGHLIPLSLQLLVDNALRHNAMSAGRPLCIDVTAVLGPAGWEVRVRNTRQHRTRRLDTDQPGLPVLLAKYRLLTPEPVRIEETDAHFTVSMPLLSPE
jgi:hypothetical protein